jgi:NAD(P)-dependent dehydrogenase (short-subunit alcohol dehydrogenase family)
VRFLAVELAEREMTVNAVAPGPTATEAFEAIGEEGLKERLVARRRWAGWATGQLIFSDGGYLLA